MTLATVTETNRPRRLRLRRTGKLTLSLDALLMALSLGVCALLFTEGGLEAAAFAIGGALIAARNARQGAKLQAAYSGGFAGLFIGALFAAFFHTAFAAATHLI